MTSAPRYRLRPCRRRFHGPLDCGDRGAAPVAIVTTDLARRREQAAAAHPEARLLPDAESLWRGGLDVDVVVIATPNRTHVPLALAAIDAGLAVVVDKPIAARAADAQTLIDAARRAGTPLTVFQNRRWDGDFLTVAALAGRGPPRPHRALRVPLRALASGGQGRLADARRARTRRGGLLFDLGAT